MSNHVLNLRMKNLEQFAMVQTALQIQIFKHLLNTMPRHGDPKETRESMTIAENSLSAFREACQALRTMDTSEPKKPVAPIKPPFQSTTKH